MDREYDDYITIADAAQSTPKPTALGTVWGWIRTGVIIGGYRVRLRSVRQGRAVFTRKAWITEFLLSCNASDPAKHDVLCEPAKPSVPKPGKRSHSNRAAHRRADEACRKARV